ncbi:MAG: tetratricopeptide repeat protein [Gammaproteobacteria bacterium]
MSFQRFTTALLLLLVPVSAVLARDAPNELAPQPIHDLRYGETLFHYFQKKYFSAITDLMVAHSTQPISTQGEDPKLLLGGLYLAYGMQDAASKLFKQILKENHLPGTHDRVWYYIGKMRYQNGNLQGAAKALLRIKHHLPADREAESLQMLANIYMAEKQYPKAIAVLRDFHGNSDWEDYAKYNLGVALVKAGQQQQGTQLLVDVGELNPDKLSHELRALRDRANLALGFAHLRGNDPADAVQDFQRIRLAGPQSNKALLGLGWAYTAQKEYKQALNPWMALQQRAELDTSVQESLIAIPYVLEKLGKKRLAMSYYDKAIRAYTAEIKRLDGVMSAVQRGELLRAMQPANIDDETSLPMHSFGLPDSISAPYLHDMMASNAFQEGYRNLQNLMYLRYVLQHWEAQLPSYRLILSERRRAYFDKLPHIASDKKLEQITQMSAQRDKLAAELKRIGQKHDGLGLVTADEAEQLKTLGKIKKSLEHLSNSQDMSEAREKYRIMQGVLYFRTQSEFIPRLWQSKRDLHELDQALARVRKTKRNLVRAANQAPRYFQGYDAKINNDRQRIATLLGKMDVAIRQTKSRIQHMAMQALIQRRQQLENYHVRARFGIARLYDSLVIEKDKQKEKTKEGGAHVQK